MLQQLVGTSFGKVAAQASTMLSSGSSMKRAASGGLSAVKQIVSSMKGGISPQGSSTKGGIASKVKAALGTMLPITSQKRRDKLDQKSMIRDARKGGGSANMRNLNQRKAKLLQNKSQMFTTQEGQAQWKHAMQQLQANYITTAKKAKRADIRGQQPEMGKQEKLQARQKLLKTRKESGASPETQRALANLNARKEKLLKQKDEFPNRRPTDQWKREMAQLQQKYRNVTSGVAMRQHDQQTSKQSGQQQTTQMTPHPQQMQLHREPQQGGQQGSRQHQNGTQMRQPAHYTTHQHISESQMRQPAHYDTQHINGTQMRQPAHYTTQHQNPQLYHSEMQNQRPLPHLVSAPMTQATSSFRAPRVSCDPHMGMCMVPFDYFQQLQAHARSRPH